MANKQEIKTFLEENNYTYEDMDKYWSVCVKGNSQCSQYAKEGRSWSDLGICEIYELSRLKDEIVSKPQKNKVKHFGRDKGQEERKKYYIENIDKVILRKINGGRFLSREELYKMTEFSVKRTYGENRKWQRSVTDICKLGDRFFMVNWEEGLTERECNDYENQPVEVFPHKTIKVIEETCFSSDREDYVLVEEKYTDPSVKQLLTNIRMCICSSFDEVKVI